MTSSRCWPGKGLRSGGRKRREVGLRLRERHPRSQPPHHVTASRLTLDATTAIGRLTNPGPFQGIHMSGLSGNSIPSNPAGATPLMV